MTLGTNFDSVLAAAQEGAEWAFTLLYRDVNPRLVRYLAAQSPSIAEDLAADTWLAAARQLTAFEGGEDDFRAWLFTIAYRQLVQHWRKAARRRTDPVSPGSFPELAGPDDPEAAGVSAMSAREAAAALAAALPPDQAQVVLLRVVAGLDVDQVATLLGKRAGTVRVLQHKAIRRLAERFSLELLTE
jgi:RNA polymerase sigma-70 factor (ECF subfamily)